MTYACQEHVELAMDTIMDEDEALPIIEKTTTKKQLSTTCSYCPKTAVYTITKQPLR